MILKRLQYLWSETNNLPLSKRLDNLRFLKQVSFSFCVILLAGLANLSITG